MSSTPVFKTIHECRVELVAYTTLSGDGEREYPESADFLPVSAARASFGNEDKTGDDPKADLKLMKFLADHEHLTPFEYNHATFLVECPLFVRSQIMRHRTFAFNEVSRRYTSEDIAFWVPDRWRKQSKSNKQGSDSETVNPSVNRHKDPLYVKYHNIKGRAKRQNIPFDLNIDDIEWVKKCPILGIPLNYSLGRGQIMPDSPSIDRIDPAGAYTKSNIRIVSSKANTMKSNATDEELIRFAEDVLLTYKGAVLREEDTYEGICRRAYRVYSDLLADGCSREQARAVLPQSLLTRFFMGGTLRNWCHFLRLRLASDAQRETQAVAQRIERELRRLWPDAMDCLMGNNDAGS